MTGEGTPGEKTHNITIPRHTAVNSQIHYEPRKHVQIDGFDLLGCGTDTIEGIVPVEGESCVANEGGVNHNGTWSSVTPTISSCSFTIHCPSN